jgi:hypothetical protein
MRHRSVITKLDYVTTLYKLNGLYRNELWDDYK